MYWNPLESPPPNKLECCEWSGRNSQIYFGRLLVGCGIFFFKAAGGTRVDLFLKRFYFFREIQESVGLLRNPQDFKKGK